MRSAYVAIALMLTSCTAGELGDASDPDAAMNDATSGGDAATPDDTSTIDATAPVDSASAPIDSATASDTTAPFDGAPADLGGDGGCTFGGSSIAAALATTVVDGAAPSGDAVLAARPGGMVVAWRSAAGLRVTPLDATGARASADLPIEGTSVFGVAAGADGYAVLVSRAPDYMTFLRISGAGAVVAKHDLIGGGDHKVVGTEWFGEFARTGRLVATSTGFAAYFALHRRWPDMIGHQGDTLRTFDAAGGSPSAVWGWGCSHSMDQRLAWNGDKVGALCLSDCYPKKAIMLNHNETTVSEEPSGNCAGGVNASLGAVVGVPGGFFAAVLSKEGRASQDVKLVRVGNDGKAAAPIWLTDTAADESSLHLARFGGGMLAAWMSGSSRVLQRLDSAGAKVSAEETTTTAWPAHDMISLPSGDAAWPSTDGGKLTIVRARACL